MVRNDQLAGRDCAAIHLIDVKASGFLGINIRCCRNPLAIGQPKVLRLVLKFVFTFLALQERLSASWVVNSFTNYLDAVWPNQLGLFTTVFTFEEEMLLGTRQVQLMN